MVRRRNLAKIESLSDLAGAFDDVDGVDATLHRAGDDGGNDTVTVEAVSTVDLESVIGPVRESRLYVFATEVFGDGTSEATINDPNDLAWL